VFFSGFPVPVNGEVRAIKILHARWGPSVRCGGRTTERGACCGCRCGVASAGRLTERGATAERMNNEDDNENMRKELGQPNE